MLCSRVSLFLLALTIGFSAMGADWTPGYTYGAGYAYYRVESDGEVQWGWDYNGDQKFEIIQYVYPAPNRPQLSIFNYFDAGGAITSTIYQENADPKELVQSAPGGVAMSRWQVGRGWIADTTCNLGETKRYKEAKRMELVLNPNASSLEKKWLYGQFLRAQDFQRACETMVLNGQVR